MEKQKRETKTRKIESVRYVFPKEKALLPVVKAYPQFDQIFYIGHSLVWSEADGEEWIGWQHHVRGGFIERGFVCDLRQRWCVAMAAAIITLGFQPQLLRNKGLSATWASGCGCRTTQPIYDAMFVKDVVASTCQRRSHRVALFIIYQTNGTGAFFHDEKVLIVKYGVRFVSALFQ